MTKKAYSLTEMAIVILIVSILATGALSVYFSLDSGVKIDENKRKLAHIYNAIGVYVQENGRLPCPAPINVARSLDVSYGVASSTPTCKDSGVYASNVTGHENLMYGMLPVQDLNLALDYSLDAYGNKFTYIVDSRFTTSASTNGFGSTDPTGIMTINDVTSSQTHKITDDALFVIISHGRNSFGSFGENLTSISNAPSDSDENENYEITSFDNTNHDADFDNIFIHDALDNEIFDDYVFFKTRDNIIVDFRAYNKVYCLDSTVSNGTQNLTYDGFTDSYNWLNSPYDYFAESPNDCPTDVQTGAGNWQLKNLRPIKRCGILGKWDSAVTVNCKKI